MGVVSDILFGEKARKDEVVRLQSEVVVLRKQHGDDVAKIELLSKEKRELIDKMDKFRLEMEEAIKLLNHQRDTHREELKKITEEYSLLKANVKRAIKDLETSEENQLDGSLPLLPIL